MSDDIDKDIIHYAINAGIELIHKALKNTSSKKRILLLIHDEADNSVIVSSDCDSKEEMIQHFGGAIAKGYSK